MPPIKTYNINVKSTVQKIKSILKHEHFKIKNINKNMSYITTNNLKDYEAVKSVLKEDNKNYFTYTPKEIKPVSFMLKGIQNTYTLEDVEDALKNIKFDSESTKFSKVFRFSTVKSRKEVRLLNLYVVQFNPSSKVQDIVKIKYLLNQSITWEYQRRNESVQCRRCQRFDHVASNCSMQYRFVKCTNTHLPGNCPNNIAQQPMDTSESTSTDPDRDSKPKPSCVNCGQEGHPANYRNCPAYKILVQRKRDRIEEIHREQQKRITANQEQVNNYRKPNITFTDIVKGNTHTPKQNLINSHTLTQSKQTEQSDALDFIQNECNANLGCDISTVINKIKIFLPRYKALTDITSKQISLIKFIMSLVDTP